MGRGLEIIRETARSDGHWWPDSLRNRARESFLRFVGFSVGEAAEVKVVSVAEEELGPSVDHHVGTFVRHPLALLAGHVPRAVLHPVQAANHLRAATGEFIDGFSVGLGINDPLYRDKRDDL
jgi:hypothetical protein